MLLLAVSKYRKKIGVIYTRTPKKRSFHLDSCTPQHVDCSECNGICSTENAVKRNLLFQKCRHGITAVLCGETSTLCDQFLPKSNMVCFQRIQIAAPSGTSGSLVL